MLEREDGELQRELSHLLSALIQLQPLLRNLQLEVRDRSFRCFSEMLRRPSRGAQKGLQEIQGIHRRRSTAGSVIKDGVLAV